MRTVSSFPRLLFVPFRLNVVFLIFVAAVGLILGCGGGGGGSATTGTTSGCTGSVLDGNLSYFTEWVDAVGQSQLISVFDANGSTVGSQVINRAGGNSAFFANLDGGKYELRSSLFSQPDGAGNIIRDLKAQIEICGNLEVTVESGGTPSSVEISPEIVTLSELDTRQLYAVGKSSAGRYLLTAVNGFSWTITGSAATISSSGRVSAKKPGSAVATARLASAGLTANSSITVTPFSARTGKWTVLVFLNAANDLFQFSDQNVNQMERVAQNEDVRFVLQWKQSKDLFPTSSFDGTRRYLVKPDTTSALASELLQDMGEGVDMGLPETLDEFITWGKRYFPAQRYVLVIWNHGNGWRRSTPGIDLTRAVSYDDESGSAIQIWELPSALGSNVFDMVAWDASLMQMAEVAYEIRSKAKLVVGSEESPPGEGYPYDTIFQQFRDNPDASSADLSNAFVTGMLSVPEYATRKITQSVIDSTKLGALASALTAYANALISAKDSIPNQIINARATAQSYSPTGSRFYRDIESFVTKLNAESGVPANVVSAGNNLVSAVKASIVHEGHNSNSSGSRGLSIDSSPSSRFITSSADYELMKIAIDTTWDDWLKVAP